MGLQRRHLLIATATATGALTLDLSRPTVALAEGLPAEADAQPIAVPLDELVNNNGIGIVPGDVNIDGSGYGFPAGSLPSGSTGRVAVGLTLPTTATPVPNVSSMHILALTLQPVVVGSAIGLRDIASDSSDSCGSLSIIEHCGFRGAV